MPQDHFEAPIGPEPHAEKSEDLSIAAMIAGAVAAEAKRFEEADEENRRAGDGGGMPNPAQAELGFNIRPEAGPFGLETTAKSANFRAGEQPPTLTLEAIADDPRNAVELPLPKDADASLLKAAHSGAEYCAEGECGLMLDALMGATPNSDAHEESAARWLQAESRLELIADRQAALEAVREAAPSLQMPDSDADREDVTRRAADESSKRQETEMRARAGEDSPANEADSSRMSLAEKMDAAVRAAEREAESEGGRESARDEGRSSEGHATEGRSR